MELFSTIDRRNESICSSAFATAGDGDNEQEPEQLQRPTSSSCYNIIFSSFNMISDGYHGSAIGFINLFLLKIYGPAIMNEAMTTRLSYAVFVGLIIGQFGFGILVDRIGRKNGSVATAILVIVGATMASAAYGATSTGMLWMIVVARGVMGVGIGGEFPCNAVVTGESSEELSPKHRGMLVVLTTTLLADFGYVLAAIVAVLLLLVFKDNLEPVWRLLTGLGVLPPLSVLYCQYYIHQAPWLCLSFTPVFINNAILPLLYAVRLKMADSKRFGNESLKRNVPYCLIFRGYWSDVLIPSLLWLLYDYITFPTSIFAAVILDQAAVNASLVNIAAWNILLYAFYLPGVIAAALVVDRRGRRMTMAIGFFGQAIMGFILSASYEKLAKQFFPLFIVLYGVFLALGECAGAGIGLAALESMPTGLRGTGYGIAAASGKVGGLIGTLMFTIIEKRFGSGGLFFACGAAALTAGVLNWLSVKETSGPTVLEEKDRNFKAYLTKHGYDISQMGGVTLAETEGFLMNPEEQINDY